MKVEDILTGMGGLFILIILSMVGVLVFSTLLKILTGIDLITNYIRPLFGI